MKKLIIFISIILIFGGSLFADSTYQGIQDEVQKKMDAIRNSGKKGPMVEEIKIDKGYYKRKTPAKEETPASTEIPANYMGTLSAMNVVAGVFEGGLIGTAVGLIGYGQTRNIDRQPLISGAIAGVISGATIAVGLSFLELATGRESASQDFAYDILGGTGVGAFIGLGGGMVAYWNSGISEDMTTGIGMGAAIGATAGLIVAVIEFLLPEKYRGGGLSPDGKSHALNINVRDINTYLTYNFEY